MAPIDNIQNINKYLTCVICNLKYKNYFKISNDIIYICLSCIYDDDKSIDEN